MILLIVLFCAILVNPSRNILYDDDFAYAWSVEELVENHRLRISDWTSSALVFQVFWGAAFCLPYGFSFAAVNISTYVISAIGLIAFFYLLEKLGFSLKKRVVSVLILFSCPLYFDFSLSFMTDIPYTSMMLISLYFFVRAIRDKEERWWIAGSISISLAFLTRQIAVCIVGGLACSFIVDVHRTKKVDWRKWICAFGPAVCIASVYFLWLNLVHGPTWCQKHIALGAALKQLDNLGQYIRLVVERFFVFSVFTTILLLPLILPFFDGFRAALQRLKADKPIAGIWFGLLGGYALYRIASEKELYVQGMLSKSILFANIPPWLWAGIFFLATLCFAAIITYGSIRIKENLLARTREKSWSAVDPVYRFLLLSFVFHLALSIGHTFIWDNYIIPILPFMLIFINRIFEKVKIHLPLAVTLVVGVLTISVFNTRFRYDYSELVWREGNALVASGVKPENIDAPLAFTGWHNYESMFARAIREIGEDKVNIFSWVRYLKPRFFLLSHPETEKDALIKKRIPYKTFGLERNFYIVEKAETTKQ